MTGSNPRAIIAVKILIKEDMIPPMRVGLEERITPKNRTVAVGFVAQKDVGQPPGERSGHPVQINVVH